MLIGAHVSVAGGYLKALEYARSVGCECMQVFAKSPRQWRGPAVDPAAAADFVAERSASGFGPVFTHTAYLINLATDDAALRAKSIPALADELVRACILGAAGVVCHVGNDPAGAPQAAAGRVAESVLGAFELAGEAGAGARLLLENTAGAGRSFGSTFEELGACIDSTGLPSARLGVCLDTCHAFAYGMALDTASGWQEAVDQIAAHCGIERLGLVHANDCLFQRGSRRDRHAWVGDGFIGEKGFEALLCLEELADVCACIEMPGEVPIKDSVNIERLKKLRVSCAQSLDPQVTR
jgi:deoxyribonuclease IV